jgi:NAD(P)-dependent dehydrogenase (short-subunit alcohol dehydrogenase family)
LGKIMLVTGASAGMGREAAILLASGGHTVYAGARRADRMDDLTEHGITPVEMDVSKDGDNERAVRRIVDAEGRIDVLINNAGFGFYGVVPRDQRARGPVGLPPHRDRALQHPGCPHPAGAHPDRVRPRRGR